MMNEALEKLRAALTGGKPVNVFFRDDDVDEDEATLRRLLQLFADRNVPLVLGVIPARLTTAGIGLLEQFSSDVELVQHGWQHVNHELTGRKCEFGASRSFTQQLDDLARGQVRMNEAFGAQWFPAFIPPWNRCTEVTAQALAQLGFRVLSKLHEEEACVAAPLQEISVTLDLFRWKNGPRLKPEVDLLETLTQQIEQELLIGIMLHHKVMDDEAFVFLERLLDELKPFANVRFHRFQSLSQSA